MTWLWASWEEYCDAVHPVAISRGSFKQSRYGTQLESSERLLSSFEKFQNAIFTLDKLGFNQDEVPVPTDPERAEKAFQPVEDAVFAGEELLLYHRRLTTSEAAYGFLHAHELYEHWGGYAGTKRAGHEVSQFLTDCRELLDGYYQMARADEQFLLQDVGDLPKHLEGEFRVARNLFSVGFDEIGLLVAGRGLEGVLRQISRDRKILLQSGQKKPRPAYDEDFADLIEVMSAVH